MSNQTVSPGTELNQDQINRILQGIAIPPQPQIMVDLQMEQLQPDCSLQNIAKLISQDVGLSGSILKTVNSAFFGLSNEITSIQQAVSLLGANTVINLVNAQSIRGSLSDDDIIALEKFWDSATEVAMASAVIAKQIGIDAADDAYTLGLFHNAGIPLLMQRFANYTEVMQFAYAQSERSITDIENEHLNTNHAVVGYYVAKSWNLPLELCRAIHEHHNVEKVLQLGEDQGRKKTLLAILKMAENIVGNHRVIGNQPDDQEWQRLEEQILLHLGLSQYDYKSLGEQIIDMGLGDSGYYA